MNYSPESAESTRDLKTWTTIHFILGLVVPAIALLLMGCKEVKEEPATIGKKVSPDEVASAIEKALAETDPYSILKDEAVFYRFTQQIETSAPSPYLDVVQTVKAIEDNDEEFKIIYDELTYDYETKEEKIVERELPPFPARPREDSIQSLQQTFSIKRMTATDDTKPEPTSTTYHDLVVTQESIDPPDIVKARPECGGVPGCKLKVTKIQYDQIDRYEDGKFDKIRYNYTLSADTPYFGRIIENCQATELPYEGRLYFLRVCQSLLDFLYGKPMHE